MESKNYQPNEVVVEEYSDPNDKSYVIYNDKSP